LMVAQIREQISDLDRRLAGTTSTDPVTGLINRREMERQMEAHKLHGSAFSLLLFELDGVIGDQLLCMAAAKLGSQFRHPEWIARWGAREFAVLFLGGPERAEKRAAQAVSSVEGTYTLESGATVVIAARSRVVNLELVAS